MVTQVNLKQLTAEWISQNLEQKLPQELAVVSGVMAEETVLFYFQFLMCQSKGKQNYFFMYVPTVVPVP